MTITSPRALPAIAVAFSFLVAVGGAEAGSGFEVITGRPQAETLARVFRSGNDKVKVVSFGGNDRLLFQMGGGDDHLIEDAASGKDRLTAGGGEGDDVLDLNGGSGDDVFTATGGFDIPDPRERGTDRVTVLGGGGKDTVNYYVTKGADRVRVDGGPGSDSARIATDGAGLTLIEKGAVLFTTPSATSSDTRITIKSLAHVKVVASSGKSLFSK